jgi:hypothetical protein
MSLNIFIFKLPIGVRLEEKKKIDDGDDNLVCLQKGFLNDEQLSLLFYAGSNITLNYSELKYNSVVMNWIIPLPIWLSYRVSYIR